MNSSSDPREVTLSAHRDYYNAGGYDDDRLAWTIATFLSDIKPEKVLEVGCGNGAMLNLLAQKGIDAVGVDASSSGIALCQNRGLRAQCLDISTEGLPFADNFFDVVISLETFEHLMNPHYALMEVRRVLRLGGRFICSVPNPRTGHPYLYPGLFEYANFRRFLLQNELSIEQVAPWQWAPRESILPESLRRFSLLRSRVVAGGIRYVIEKMYLAVGAFPAFSYWLWTFKCRNNKSGEHGIFREVSEQTRPGASKHFSVSK
jgi:methionine biosynthesis protein MetW